MQTQPKRGDDAGGARLTSSDSSSVPSRAGPLSLLCSSQDLLHPNPRPTPVWPPFPFPLLSDGYSQGLSSDREPRLHQGGLQALRGCGLPADSATPPPAACGLPPAGPPRLSGEEGLRRRLARRAWEPGSPGASRRAGEPGGESLTRERAAPPAPAPARLPGRRRFRPLRPTWGTAARHPKDLGSPEQVPLQTATCNTLEGI